MTTLLKLPLQNPTYPPSKRLKRDNSSSASPSPSPPVEIPLDAEPVPADAPVLTVEFGPPILIQTEDIVNIPDSVVAARLKVNRGANAGDVLAFFLHPHLTPQNFNTTNLTKCDRDKTMIEITLNLLVRAHNCGIYIRDYERYCHTLNWLKKGLDVLIKTDASLGRPLTEHQIGFIDGTDLFNPTLRGTPLEVSVSNHFNSSRTAFVNFFDAHKEISLQTLCEVIVFVRGIIWDSQPKCKSCGYISQIVVRAEKQISAGVPIDCPACKGFGSLRRFNAIKEQK